MEDLFGFSEPRDRKKHETRHITFYANGSTSNKTQVAAHPGEDELWKIKKRLLKKLDFKNYKSEKL